jgi:outer membrane protein
VKRLACIVLLAACAHATAEPSDDLLTLYTQARPNYPALQQAVAQAGVADAGADRERAALLPQWSLSVAPQRADGATTNIATSQISQALVNLAALDSWQAARSDATAQDANLRAAEQALLAEVAVRYFALLSAQNQLGTLTANEAAFAELVRQSEVRVTERLSAQVDVDQARAYLGLAQGATQQAREAVADARQAIQELTGQAPLPLRPLRQGFRPVAPQPASPAAWVTEALAGHPLLQAGSASVIAAQERINAARAGHLPTLGLTFTTQRAPLGGLPTGPQSTNSALGLQLTIPLVQGGATLAQQKGAVHARESAAAQLEATRRHIVRNVQAQWQAAQGSVTEIATAEAAALAAARSLAAVRAGHQYGTRSLFDVLNAIQTDGQAQLELTQSRHRHVVALLLLKQAAGHLSVDDLVSINTLLETEPGRAAGNSH